MQRFAGYFPAGDAAEHFVNAPFDGHVAGAGHHRAGYATEGDLGALEFVRAHETVASGESLDAQVLRTQHEMEFTRAFGRFDGSVVQR